MENTSHAGDAAHIDASISTLLGAPNAPRKRQIEGDTLLSDPNILALFGGISRMTLWRWRQELGFPEGAHEVAGRRYTWKSQVLSWLAERPPKSAPPANDSEHRSAA